MISPTGKKSEMNPALQTLFDSHFSDASNALKRFRDHLAAAQLDFDVEASIEVLDSPPQVSFPHGLPSFIYYYIYGTRFGTVKKIPAAADDSAHALTSDGIGLNMGCPIRLARALDVLFSLKPDDQKEPIAQIKARENHFACVEELLWLTLWKNQAEVGRGGELVPQKNGNKVGDVDWFFISNGTPIYLEAKFRPTDWLRNPDCGGGTVDEGFFGKIGHKFPAEKSSLRKCVAAITGFAEPGHSDADNSFFALCEKKLLSTPGLDAILYRSLLGPIYVCSLYEDVVAQIVALIRYPELHEYPPCYPVLFNRKLCADRAAIKKRTRLPEQGRIIFAIVPDNKPSPSFRPEYPYRCSIPKRGRKGEPYIQYVPPFLNLLSAKDGSNR